MSTSWCLSARMIIVTQGEEAQVIILGDKMFNIRLLNANLNSSTVTNL